MVTRVYIYIYTFVFIEVISLKSLNTCLFINLSEHSDSKDASCLLSISCSPGGTKILMMLCWHSQLHPQLPMLVMLCRYNRL